MDIKYTFKKLLTSQYIPDLNYMDVKFSFLTVFKNSSHTYRCCTCAYEHEYLDYVSETGKVNEEMFDKVVGNIMNGKCPHVADVPEDCVTETCIFPIHIAAALGTEKALEDYKRYCGSHSGKDRDSIHGSVFHLHPFEIALFKNNIQAASFMRYEFSGTCCFTCTFVLCASRSLDHVNRIQFECLSVPEFYVRTTNNSLLQRELFSLSMSSEVAKALFTAFLNGTTDLKDNLLACMKHVTGGLNPLIIQLYTILAIYYDQSEVLATLLSAFPQVGISEDTKCFIAEACSVLKRQNCQTVLSRFNFTGQKFTLHRDYPRLKKMVSFFLLDEFSAQFSDEVKNSVKQNLKDAINLQETKDIGILKSERFSLLQHYIRTSTQLHTETMKVLLEVDGDIDNVHHDLGTPLTHLLRKFHFDHSIRSATELLIYANSSLKLNNCAVDIAFGVDEKTKAFVCLEAI